MPDWHLGPDGSTLESRLRGAGAAFIARSENIFWRLGFGERVGDPCTMFESFTPTHIRNYMGEYPGVIQEPLYHGTACYVDYGARLVACVQDFIVPP